MRYFIHIIMILMINSAMMTASAAPSQLSSLNTQFAGVEAKYHGRLGLYALDTGNQQQVQYHANQAFPMGSTFKVVGVGAFLKKSMAEPRLMKEKILFNQNDIESWAPITKMHLDTGMTAEELCAAAISYSDSTAINLLANHFLGGDRGINAFARSIGDNDYQLHLDNNAIGGSSTTTPSAMAASLQKLALGNILGETQRTQLLSWMKDTTTGNLRIRAGVPKGWIVADKTGTVPDTGSANDVAVIWPSHCAPLIVAIYFSHDKKTNPTPEAIASATRIAIQAFTKTNKCLTG